MEIIPGVAGNKATVINAEFIKLTIFNDVLDPEDTTIFTFSSSYRTENIDGQDYTALGGLLAVGVQQRDIRATSADTTITLSGIPVTESGNETNNIEAVLGYKIKGSRVDIIRGFYDDNYVLANTAHRFSGIVTSYNIEEDRAEDHDNFTVAINASSFKLVLENRISGRKTNEQSWKEFDPTDTSMDNVYSLSGTTFDFGVPVT